MGRSRATQSETEAAAILETESSLFFVAGLKRLNQSTAPPFAVEYFRHHRRSASKS